MSLPPRGSSVGHHKTLERADSSHRPPPSPLPCSNQNISSAESEHVQTRLNPDNFLSYLEGINLTASDLNLNLNSSSPTSSTPNVALAFSGGGYRAMISGGGQLWGTDARNDEAKTAGVAVGGVASYFAGLRSVFLGASRPRQ